MDYNTHDTQKVQTLDALSAYAPVAMRRPTSVWPASGDATVKPCNTSWP